MSSRIPHLRHIVENPLIQSRYSIHSIQMSTPYAVLGATAAARAQAEGTGLKMIARNSKIVYVALFASLVCLVVGRATMNAYRTLGRVPIRLPTGSTRSSLRHVFFPAEVPRRSCLSEQAGLAYIDLTTRRLARIHHLWHRMRNILS
jgi:hypothetical protein